MIKFKKRVCTDYMDVLDIDVLNQSYLYDKYACLQFDIRVLNMLYIRFELHLMNKLTVKLT